MLMNVRSHAWALLDPFSASFIAHAVPVFKKPSKVFVTVTPSEVGIDPIWSLAR